jgi:hypothetical protein
MQLLEDEQNGRNAGALDCGMNDAFVCVVEGLEDSKKAVHPPWAVVKLVAFLDLEIR